MVRRTQSLPSEDTLTRIYGHNADHGIVWLKKAAPTERGHDAEGQVLPTTTEVQWCLKILDPKEFARLFTGWGKQASVDKVVAQALLA